MSSSGLTRRSVSEEIARSSRAMTDEASRAMTDISESSLMKNMVLVNHESYLFKGSIRDNLLMAKPEATDSELETVLSKVNLLDFVQANGGLDYQLTEAASNLSGGQRQRLALARALLLNPQVFIFDEATSSIDVESEEQIMTVIQELAKSKIIILISHRLANVVNSNKIYYLQDGKIAEEGSHKQLMKIDGEYSRLYKKQKELENFAGGAK
jgi:ATP-binding cassette subfamily C protein